MSALLYKVCVTVQEMRVPALGFHDLVGVDG